MDGKTKFQSIAPQAYENQADALVPKPFPSLQTQSGDTRVPPTKQSNNSSDRQFISSVNFSNFQNVSCGRPPDTVMISVGKLPPSRTAAQDSSRRLLFSSKNGNECSGVSRTDRFCKTWRGGSLTIAIARWQDRTEKRFGDQCRGRAYILEEGKGVESHNSGGIPRYSAVFRFSRG